MSTNPAIIRRDFLPYVENNTLAVPAPVPVPGVPVGPGDKVKQDADRKIASGLQGVIEDATDWLDKVTQCSFGRACSSDDPGQESKPNVAGNMTEDEKAEYGGAGSGTPTPPENDHEKQESKPVDKLNQKQESAIKKIDNTIKNALKDHDITGTLKDMDGNPVPKESGGYWDHMQEMQNTLWGLRNHAETLKNVNNPEAQAAYGRATDAINKIESALKDMVYDYFP
nr:polymorphic toxin type 28 domain-containing protein [[Enterobacter] lignolyticus]